MKSKNLAAAALALISLASCSANKTNDQTMESKEPVKETVVGPDNIDLAIALGEENATGHVEVYDMGDFKLHVYYTQDVMNDASYIVEGKDSVVTMEQPLFKVNVSEFNSYLDKVGKPVAKRITDYHVGGQPKCMQECRLSSVTARHPTSPEQALSSAVRCIIRTGPQTKRT